MSQTSISVNKRNGRGTEPLNIDKIHKMVGFACEDLSGVSESQVEMNSDLQFYDGVNTSINPKLREIGLLTVFPSFTWHQITPITKGTRYALVGWVHGETFK